MKRRAFLVGSAAASLASCAHAGPIQHFDVLDGSSNPLRSRFNAASNKVRVLMLVSPT
jgi:hypothetical protein